MIISVDTMFVRRLVLGFCAWLAGIALLPAAEVAIPWDAKGVKDFSLTDRSGITVTKQDLLGKPWVVGFIFTRCAGPCPKVTAKMNELYRETGTRMVTITVDPDFDTPEKLATFAEAFGAPPPGAEPGWYFLTGNKTQIYDLIQTSFLQPVAPMSEDDFLHSTNLLYVDADGRVLRKFNVINDDEFAALKTYLQTPPWVHVLPTVNATLNGIAGILLGIGYFLILMKRRKAHEYTMYAAFATSVVFLCCYLVYHAFAGSKPFEGTGPVRIVYFVILISHIILAATVPVLAILTIRYGRRAEWVRHRRIAQITFPIWVYVSITGVVIYVMLYHWH